MARMGSCSSPPAGSSAPISGMGGLNDEIVLTLARSYFGETSTCHRTLRRLGGSKYSRRGFVFQIRDFAFDLRFELVAGTLEFVRSFDDLTPNLVQFLGPKNNEDYKENEHHLRKAKIHTSIILPDLHCQQSERLLQTVVDCSVMSKPLPIACILIFRW